MGSGWSEVALCPIGSLVMKHTYPLFIDHAWKNDGWIATHMVQMTAITSGGNILWAAQG